MKKQILAVTAFLAAALFSVTAFGSISLTIDGQPLASDVPPTVVGGRTLVPVRAIFEGLGATVSWNDETKTVTAVKDFKDIVLVLNSKDAKVNGLAKTLDVPAQIINERTMVPARFVAESLDCSVIWDEATQTVAITTSPNADHPLENLAAENVNQDIDRPIYITKTGSKYHYDSSCNGGTYYETTLEDAISKGLEPCKKCIG